jgi:hypothetical protein
MRWGVTLVLWVAGLLVCSLYLGPGVQAQSPGQTKAMNQRADTVIKQKKRFLTKVLREHGISCETDLDGMITHINAHGDWLAVRKLDVVPVPKENDKAGEVVGHEVFIYTDGEAMRLFSDSRVR